MYKMQIKKIVLGNLAFKLERLKNLYFLKTSNYLFKFEQYCTKHLFNSKQKDYITLVRILDIE